ncbi:uncharacterized protein [Panulirus ornatus]|uniref:uncharacterized protein isoform X3 n=1 Tax=Panulirus ornatus TaxID=150431 RepID=UPI003A8BBAC6
MSSPNSAEVSGSPSPAPSSIGNNAPKYGTLVPNRVFVGGISASTTEQDLLELFSQYGTVKATKIISDRAGVSKGYGFVTFETEEEARRLTQEADDIMLKDRKLNIAPAIKKQVSDVGYLKTYSPRLIESSGSVVGTSGTVFFGNGAAYTTYGNTMPVMAPAEYHPTFPQAPAAPTTPSTYPTIVYPQPLYYPQQYQYQPTQTVQPQWGVAPQWRWITPASYPQPECSPQQCLVEPSSPAQGDLTAASAMGSPLLISTPLTLACPSTPTTAITTTSTTTVCTTVTITSTSSTKTTATTTSTSTKMLRTHDSLLQIKPLSVAGKTTPASGKSKYNPTVTPKTTLAVDKNNNSAEQGGWGKRRQHTSQYPADIPPRYLRSRLPQQQHFQQYCGFYQQHSVQQLAQHPQQNNQEQWTNRSQEKRTGGRFTERNARPRKQQANEPDTKAKWESKCKQSAISCGWVLYGNDDQQQQYTEQSGWDWRLEWVDTNGSAGKGSRMGVPSREFLLVSSPWGSGSLAWQSCNSAATSPTNVPIMGITWVDSNSTTFPLIQLQEHYSQQQQQRSFVAASPELLSTQRIFDTWRNPSTAIFPSSSVPSTPPNVRDSTEGITYQHLYSSTQGYSFMLNSSNQQQQQYQCYNYQYLQQQDQQFFEQPNPGSEWNIQSLPNSVSWKWNRADNVWVHESTATSSDALLPVWGNCSTILPLGGSFYNAVAIDPKCFYDSFYPSPDNNNNNSSTT